MKWWQPWVSAFPSQQQKSWREWKPIPSIPTQLPLPTLSSPLCQLLPRLREPGNHVDRCKTQITLPLRSCNPASIRFPTVRLWLHGAYFAQTASLSPVQAPYLAFARISQILYMIRDTILSFSDWCHREMSKVCLWLWHEWLWFVYRWNRFCVPVGNRFCVPLSELSFSAQGPMLAPLSPQGHVTWSDLPAETIPRPWSPGASVRSAVGYAAVANANSKHAAGNILILYH